MSFIGGFVFIDREAMYHVSKSYSEWPAVGFEVSKMFTGGGPNVTQF